MTTADVLARADSPETLLEGLGYVINPVEIDLVDWADCGLDLGLPPGGSMRRLFRTGEVVFLALAGVKGSEVRPCLERLSINNKVEKYIIIFYDDKGLVFTISTSSNGRVRRIDLPRRDPRADALERLELLRFDRIGGSVRSLRTRLNAAFDRESLARQFFERFRSCCEDLSARIAESRGDVTVAEARDEALLILSRILFLYFLQEKGWLGSDPRYIASRFEAARSAGSNFFATVLQPLFFGCLNTPIDRRSPASRELGEIPYLNGGLFEPSSFEKVHATLELPNESFELIVGGLFERFTFSLREDDEEGTHIDPEMLGKVFESLMEKDERARTGTFYTPRPIVSGMISGAVTRRVSGGDGKIEERLRECLGNRSALLEAQQAREVRSRLESLAVLDLACGSGAFLLSALDVIEKLLRACYRSCREDPPLELRKRIVERSLYGVDLKIEAVRLCELRLWLALVSDPLAPAACAGKIPPLPNLDRNIRQGNSLLGPLDFLGDGRRDVYRDWSRSMKDRGILLDRYRRAEAEEKPNLARSLRESDRDLGIAMLERSVSRDEEDCRLIESQAQLFESEEKKRVGHPLLEEIRERIDKSKRRIEGLARGESEFFAFEVHFAHVLEEGGFDVVAGNPPWVRSSRIDASTRRQLRERYETFGASGSFDQSDLSLAFVEKAASLAREGGVITQLVPSKLASARYGERWRSWIDQKNSLVSLEDWSHAPRRLFAAATFPLGVTFTRGVDRVRSIRVRNCVGVWEVDRDEIGGPSPADPWILAPPEVAKSVAALRERFETLTEVVGRRPIMGVKTGSNRHFFLESLVLENGGARLGTNGPEIPLSSVCRCVRGRDVRRWKAEASTWMLWPPIRGWADPPRWVLDLAASMGVDPSSFRLSYVKPEHLGIKVAWKDVSRGLQAVVLPEAARVSGREFPLVPNQTLYSIETATLDDAYLLAALFNSTTLNALATISAEPAKDRHARYFGRLIGGLPCPSLDRSDADIRRLTRLGRLGHQGVEVQVEIDEIVDRLYGLATSDALGLRRFLEQRLGNE